MIWLFYDLVMAEETRAGMTAQQHMDRPWRDVHQDRCFLDALAAGRAYYRKNPIKG